MVDSKIVQKNTELLARRDALGLNSSKDKLEKVLNSEFDFARELPDTTDAQVNFFIPYPLLLLP